MKQIEIFNEESLELLDMCFAYESVKVVRKFRGIGSIDIALTSLEEGDKFKVGRYICFNGETYICEDVHQFKEANGTPKVEISGRHINQILAERVLLPDTAEEEGKIANLYSVQSGVAYSALAVRMVKECFVDLVSPYNTGDWTGRIAPIECKAHGATLLTENDYTIKAPVLLSEALNKVLSNKRLGYCVKVDYERKTRTFNVYEPETKDVLFSEMFGNINDADFYENITDEKTKAIYASEGALVYSAQGSNESGLKRKEMLMDDSSSDWKTSHRAKKSASFDALDTGTFKYKEDFDLGDIVDYYNATFGISTTQQIAEVTEQYDSIETVSITIGDFIPTIYDRLKGVL